MKKLLYITPHLSTGGLPQYLLKKIEHFKNDFDIHLIEYQDLSWEFVVQKNKTTLENLIKFFDQKNCNESEDFPLLLIDDECEKGSVNKKKKAWLWTVLSINC